MIHRIAADLVLLLHLAFIVFVVLGGGLVLIRPRLSWVHLPAVIWGAFVELAGLVCPLTPLENRLRVASGSAGYTGGFIDRHLIPVVYPPDLSRPIQIALGLAVVLINAVFYALLVRRGYRPRGRTSAD
jgi:hypothetical protein